MKLTAEQFQAYKDQTQKVGQLLEQATELYKSVLRLYNGLNSTSTEAEETQRRREMTESLAMNGALLHGARTMLIEAVSCFENNLAWVADKDYLSPEDLAIYKIAFPDPMEEMLKQMGLVQSELAEAASEVGDTDLTALDPSIGKQDN